MISSPLEKSLCWDDVRHQESAEIEGGALRRICPATAFRLENDEGQPDHNAPLHIGDELAYFDSRARSAASSRHPSIPINPKTAALSRCDRVVRTEEPEDFRAGTFSA